MKQDGQIQYDDSLTETPIGTIIYAIDDESSETDSTDKNRNKNFQLQDVVTHGNINDKSFINHNLFTIGDDNDANVETESDEDDDDDMDDMVDNDGVIDKQATNSKLSNFAFSSDKPIRHPVSSVIGEHSSMKSMTMLNTKTNPNSNKNDNENLQSQLQPHNHFIVKQQQQPQQLEKGQQKSILNGTNDDKNNHDLHQGQHRAPDNVFATHLTNGQMTYKQSSK